MKGDIVYSPDGEKIVLADIGSEVLLDDEVVRVWDVSLDPGELHPWHLHHNPYVVLSLQGSPGRMDWLDGSEPRFLNEYRGGAVYRPVSPVHRLTNIGDRHYQNRLVELKDLGEHLPSPVEFGPGARSVQGESIGPVTADSRHPVLAHPHVTVWTVDLAAGQELTLDLAPVPHVLAAIETGDVRVTAGGPVTLHNPAAEAGTWFVVELTYRMEPAG